MEALEAAKVIISNYGMPRIEKAGLNIYNIINEVYTLYREKPGRKNVEFDELVNKFKEKDIQVDKTEVMTLLKSNKEWLKEVHGINVNGAISVEKQFKDNLQKEPTKEVKQLSEEEKLKLYKERAKKQQKNRP